MSTPPTIPASHLDILEKKAFAHLATVGANGAPQVTPVWFAYDGSHFLINSAQGRTKDRNLRAHPYVALSIPDPDDPYRYIGVQGIVDEITEEGAAALINELSRKYHGRDFNIPAGQVRVTYKITPTRIWGH